MAAAIIRGNRLAPAQAGQAANKAHLAFVASQPCLVCQRSPCDAHHLKFAQTRSPWRVNSGKQRSLMRMLRWLVRHRRNPRPGRTSGGLRLVKPNAVIASHANEGATKDGKLLPNTKTATFKAAAACFRGRGCVARTNAGAAELFRVEPEILLTRPAGTRMKRRLPVLARNGHGGAVTACLLSGSKRAGMAIVPLCAMHARIACLLPGNASRTGAQYKLLHLARRRLRQFVDKADPLRRLEVSNRVAHVQL